MLGLKLIHVSKIGPRMPHPIGKTTSSVSSPPPCQLYRNRQDLSYQSVVGPSLPTDIVIMHSLQLRHNERHGVSNHQPHDCLLNRISRRLSKKASKLRVTGLYEGNSPVTGEFPTQRASNVSNVSIWWRHHVNADILPFPPSGVRTTQGTSSPQVACHSPVSSRHLPQPGNGKPSSKLLQANKL